MLKRRNLVFVVPLRPRHAGARVHLPLADAVELIRCGGALSGSLAFAAELGVLAPQSIFGRPLVDELRPLALPRRMPSTIKEPIGEIVRADHGDRAEARDLLPRPGKAEDGSAQDLLAGGHLRWRGT